jgi:hypothetical protein
MLEVVERNETSRPMMYKFAHGNVLRWAANGHCPRKARGAGCLSRRVRLPLLYPACPHTWTSRSQASRGFQLARSWSTKFPVRPSPLQVGRPRSSAFLKVGQEASSHLLTDGPEHAGSLSRDISRSPGPTADAKNFAPEVETEARHHASGDARFRLATTSAHET